MKKWKFTLLFILAIVGSVYLFLGDYLPPRTPRKIAKLTSKVDIPWGADVVLFDIHWVGMSPNGYDKVIFKLSKQDYQALKKECIKSGYKPMSSKELHHYLHGDMIPSSLSANAPIFSRSRFVYKLVRPVDQFDSLDYAIVVLDDEDRHVMFFNSVS